MDPDTTCSPRPADSHLLRLAAAAIAVTAIALLAPVLVATAAAAHEGHHHTAMGTIDAIDDDGQHLGGQIFPGVRLMLESLAASTSDIPAVGGRLRATTGLDMFGDTTSKAVQHGAWNAVTGAIDRAITILRSNAYDPAVVLTGGDASRMLTALGTEPLHRPHLVLQGLARMLRDTLDER